MKVIFECAPSGKAFERGWTSLLAARCRHKCCRVCVEVPPYLFLKLSLLGLMAKIKCSICSYQFNI